MRHVITVCTAHQHPGAERGCQAAPSPESKFKKQNIFYIHDDIKPFMSFTIQAKSATVTG